MKKVFEAIKNKYYILVIIIVLLSSFIGIDLYYFEHTERGKKHNPYDIVVNSNDNFVFLGDSITDFYKVNEWFDELPVINSGVSGYTTDDILKNVDDMVSIYNPTKVFILIGTNDIQLGKSEDYIMKNIEKIAKSIISKRPDTKIYIESIYPINNTDNEIIDKQVVGIRNNKTIMSINKKIKNYCNKKGFQYINVYDKLTDKNGNLKIEYTKEGLHLSDTGYLKVTKTLYRYLNK